MVTITDVTVSAEREADVTVDAVKETDVTATARKEAEDIVTKTEAAIGMNEEMTVVTRTETIVTVTKITERKEAAERKMKEMKDPVSAMREIPVIILTRI